MRRLVGCEYGVGVSVCPYVCLYKLFESYDKLNYKSLVVSYIPS